MTTRPDTQITTKAGFTDEKVGVITLRTWNGEAFSTKPYTIYGGGRTMHYKDGTAARRMFDQRLAAEDNYRAEHGPTPNRFERAFLNDIEFDPASPMRRRLNAYDAAVQNHGHPARIACLRMGWFDGDKVLLSQAGIDALAA